MEKERIKATHFIHQYKLADYLTNTELMPISWLNEILEFVESKISLTSIAIFKIKAK